VVWAGLIWLRIGTSGKALMNTVINFRIPLNVGKFLSCCTTGGFSKRARLHEVSLRVRKCKKTNIKPRRS
jgi:hypothetical protein